MSKAKRPLETRSIDKVGREPHAYEADTRTGHCRCGLPENNRLHNPANLRQPTAEQRAADLARLGERED